LDFIFERPIFKSSDFTHTGGIPTPSAKWILGLLRENGIIKIIKVSSGRRSAVYAYPALLNIAEGKNVF
jgi:hypothetical protein